MYGELAMHIPIKRTVERIPGGMIVPLAVGSAIATFAPHAGAFFGSFTGALFTGALPILAVFYVCIGAKISLRSLPRVLRKGGALTATKFALGLAAFPWQTLVGAILPLAVGMLLGNLDPDLRAFLSNGATMLIPFFAFALGATLNLHRVWEAGLLGLALGLVLVFLCGVCLILVDHLIGGNGTAGIAASTTPGAWRCRSDPSCKGCRCCALNVSFSPTTTQTYTNVGVGFGATSSGGGPTQAVTFTVSGTGTAATAPVAGLTPNPLAFPNSGR